MISSSVLLKEGEFWFAVNHLYVSTNGYLRLGGYGQGEVHFAGGIHNTYSGRSDVSGETSS